MVRTNKTAPALCLLLALAPGIARADFNVAALLTGSNEIPPNSSSGTGQATVTFNSAADDLTYVLSYNNLRGAAFTANIHFGNPGSIGPVVLKLATPTGTSGKISGTLTAADFFASPSNGINTFSDAVNAIQTGHSYINIHTTAFIGGEIRGQLLPVPELGSLTAMLVLMGLGAHRMFALQRHIRSQETDVS